ncbi:MAG: hypothetical protein H0T76_03920 [Nannocystis sp.]|nr:hypothetical protein [Nannocystis sp.]MBA3545608.1 hypothetical protein [Nannocystis sp.]
MLTPILPLLLAATLLAACGAVGAEALAEPRILQFTPAHTELPVRLVHRGDTPLPLAKLRIDHSEPDWSAFTITDAELPRQIEPGGAVTLHLRVDADHFQGPDHHSRRGAATLTLLAGGQPVRVPLRFSDPEPATLAQLVRLGLLAGLTAGGIMLRRVPWTRVVLAVAAVAIAPVGLGMCLDAGGQPLTAVDLQQCADGRGGIALQLLPHAEGLGLLIGLVLFIGTRSIAGGIKVGDADDLRRALTLALVLIAFATAGGSLDPQVLMQAQQGLHWGLWQQPLSVLALIFAALFEVQAARRGASPWPARIAAIGLAAMITTLCLGGPDLPGMLALPHATSIAAGITVWLLKLAAVTSLLLRIRPPMGLSRVVVPLAIGQILLALWHLRGV